jgi:hypothetical protein
MDLKTRKLNLISYIAHVEDENLLREIESYISRGNDLDYADQLKPFTHEDFMERIKKSERAIANGDFKTQEEFEKIVESW